MSAPVAVLMPVCNAGRFLKEAVGSVLDQNLRDFDLFCCDDGSEDNSLEILKEFAAKDARVHILENPRNLGIVATRNHLLSVLTEDVEYIAWLDADDVMFPDRLQRQTGYLNAHPEIGGVGSSLEIIDENSRVIGSRSYPETLEEIRKALPLRNVLAQPAMTVRKALISKTGEYSVKCPVCHDYEYWLRALDHFDFANSKEPVLHYRISSTQVKQSRLKQSLRITLQIQNDYFQRIGQSKPLTLKLHHAAVHLLLLLPAPWIMKLFVLLTYRKPEKKK